MTVELLQILSWAAFITAAVFFMVAVALFFLLDVPKLYGDISGRTAKKSIEAIRSQNESTGNKAYKPSAVNAKRGKITEKISGASATSHSKQDFSIGVGTEKLRKKQTEETTVLNCDSNETTVLSNNETTVLSAQSKETIVLSYVSNETTVLSAQSQESVFIQTAAEAITTSEFTVDVEMSFTGSSEIIE